MVTSQVKSSYANETVYEQWLRINHGDSNVGEKFL